VNPRARSLVLPVLATAVVAAAVLEAIVILGGPQGQRERKMDEVRVQNLMLIQSSVNGYFMRHKELPPDLEALTKEPGYRIVRNDPGTGRAYEYQVVDATNYRLCAEFRTDSAADTGGNPASVGVTANVAWAHGVGHQCFDRDTDRHTAAR